MGLDGDHLLKRLQPVIRPRALDQRPRGDVASKGDDFARLIEMASRGQIATGRPIEHASVSELDQDRLDRLGTACDALESAGMRRGAVMMEGRAFLIDVADRSILNELGTEDAGAVQELEGVIRVLGPDEGNEDTSSDSIVPIFRANPAVPPGVLAQLERSARRNGA